MLEPSREREGRGSEHSARSLTPLGSFPGFLVSLTIRLPAINPADSCSGLLSCLGPGAVRESKKKPGETGHVGRPPPVYIAASACNKGAGERFRSPGAFNSHAWFSAPLRPPLAALRAPFHSAYGEAGNGRPLPAPLSTVRRIRPAGPPILPCNPGEPVTTPLHIIRIRTFRPAARRGHPRGAIGATPKAALRDLAAPAFGEMEGKAIGETH